MASKFQEKYDEIMNEKVIFDYTVDGAKKRIKPSPYGESKHWDENLETVAQWCIDNKIPFSVMDSLVNNIDTAIRKGYDTKPLYNPVYGDKRFYVDIKDGVVQDIEMG